MDGSKEGWMGRWNDGRKEGRKNNPKKGKGAKVLKKKRIGG
jgi:hypothetical protein